MANITIHIDTAVISCVSDNGTTITITIRPDEKQNVKNVTIRRTPEIMSLLTIANVPIFTTTPINP